MLMTGFFSSWQAVMLVVAILAMMIWVAIRLLFLWLVVTRFSYWLAITQQKEYRWDRLKLFLATKDGQRALVMGWPWLVFRLQKLKRPKMTLRIVLIALMSTTLWFLTWHNELHLMGVNSWKILDQTQIQKPSLLQILRQVQGIPSVGVESLVQHDLIRNDLVQNDLAQTDEVWLLIQNNRSIFVVGWWLVCWWLVPGFVGLATLPTWLVSEGVTRWRLRKAKFLIDKHRPLIIGITGSYGKTSTRHILAHLLGDNTQVWTPADSHNTSLSIATDVIATYQGQPIVVLEYGAYTESEIAKITKYFPPQLAIITGLTFQHGGLFGSLEKIVQAKSELIAALPAKSVVYWNADCPEAEKIVKVGLSAHRQMHDQPQVEVKQVDANSVKISEVSIANWGQLQFKFAHQAIYLSLVGIHYVENIAMAIAVVRDQGVPISQVVTRLQSFQPNRYFTRAWRSQTGVVVVDDGGSCNPAGFASIIELAKQINVSPKVLITSGIVDLGDESSRIHKELAAKSKLIIDQVFYTGEAGREEFQAVLGERVVTDQKLITDKMKNLESGTLLILEGRLPGWVIDLVPRGMTGC